MGIRHTFILLVSFNSFSQMNNSTFSPYSLFGIGKFNDVNTGVTNSLGKSGVALGTVYEINGLNPASLSHMNRNSFFFDIGVKTEYNVYGDSNDSDAKPTLFNFSNISLAFPVGKKSAMSLSLLPFTEVGYLFQGIVSDIEGTNVNAISTITGSGGLNSFNINYGRIINKKLSLGLSAKYFFGSIKQTELVQLQTDLLSLRDIYYYRGYKFEVGLQYKISDKLNSGFTANLPSYLNGFKDRKVSRIEGFNSTLIDSNSDIKLENYQTPFDFTIGIKYDYKNYSFFSDYKRTFWSSTGLVDNIGKYTDSNIIGFGLEYFRKSDNISKRISKCRYRLGFNYDDGNLRVNDTKIANSTLTTGIGIPFGKNYNTFMNISYSYGTKGLISNTLIRENYHTLTVNLSFEDKWFVKRLYD